MKKLISLACITVFLVACNSSYENGNTSLKNETQKTIISKITKGKTTQAKVVELFGEPESTSIHSGNEMWVYSYNSYVSSNDKKYLIPIVGSFLGSRTDGQHQLKSLTIFFNKKGIVEDYSFSGSASKSTIKTNGF